VAGKFPKREPPMKLPRSVQKPKEHRGLQRKPKEPDSGGKPGEKGKGKPTLLQKGQKKGTQITPG